VAAGIVVSRQPSVFVPAWNEDGPVNAPSRSPCGSALGKILDIADIVRDGNVSIVIQERRSYRLLPGSNPLRIAGPRETQTPQRLKESNGEVTPVITRYHSKKLHPDSDFVNFTATHRI